LRAKAISLLRSSSLSIGVRAYRMSAKIGQAMHRRQEALPTQIRDIALEIAGEALQPIPQNARSAKWAGCDAHLCTSGRRLEPQPAPLNQDRITPGCHTDAPHCIKNDDKCDRKSQLI